MVSDPIRIRIQSSPENLIDVRRAMARILCDTKLSKEERGEVILAVDEACSNIIRHGYKNDYTRPIDLDVELTTDHFSVIISDQGIEFDVDCIKKRDICEIKPGGLGVYIIYHAMDTVRYSRTKDGLNQLRMVKNLK